LKVKNPKIRTLLAISVFAFLTFCISQSAAAAGISWSKAWTSTNTGTFGTYPNGYEDIRFDPFTMKTWLYTTDTSNTGQGIYSTRLHYFDATTSADTVIGDNGQTISGGCVPSSDIWPFSHHAVGQFFIDQIRHRAISFEGTACSDVGAEQWYYQLTNPIDGHATWVQQEPAHLPMANSQSSYRISSLSGGAGGLGTTLNASDTTMYLANPSGFAQGDYVKIDSEIVKIVGNGGTHGYTTSANGGTPGTNPFAILRGRYGTTAASHASSTAVYVQEGQFNSGAIVDDTYDDAFFLFGLPQSGLHALYVYCDTSANPIPGVLTSAQTQVGCAYPDDWTDITSKSICSDPSCVAFVTGTNGANSGKIPPGYYYPSLQYDNLRHKLMTWAGGKGYGTGSYLSTIQYGVYTYDPETFTWTLASTTCTDADCQAGHNSPPAQANNTEGWRMTQTFNTNDGKFYYHLSLRPNPTVPQTEDWVYDPSTFKWTELDTNQGPNYSETMTYDSGCNCLVAWGISTSTQSMSEIWVGQLSTSSPDTTPPALSSIASSTTASAATITWTTDEAATSKVVYGTTASYGSATSSGTLVTSHSLSLASLLSSTLYHFAVVSADASGNTSTSSDYTFTTSALDTSPPSSPTGLAATAVSSSQINLAWTASTDSIGVVGYKIYRNAAQIATSTGTTYSDIGLSASTTYSYMVAAYDAAGNVSTQSSSASATTQVASSGGSSGGGSSGGGGGGSSSSSGGGSSSGTSGGGASQVVVSTSTLPLVSTVSTTTVSIVPFTSDLKPGMHSADVARLQTVLMNLGFLASGNNTGYYGPRTIAAVQAFQKARSIVTSGTPGSTGYGAVGPKTRAVLNTLLAPSSVSSTSQGVATPITLGNDQDAIDSLRLEIARLIALVAQLTAQLAAGLKI
jgi:peptidoglycan hydrolase-like protein with peptidoglycan-binding domain